MAFATTTLRFSNSVFFEKYMYIKKARKSYGKVIQ